MKRSIPFSLTIGALAFASASALVIACSSDDGGSPKPQTDGGVDASPDAHDGATPDGDASDGGDCNGGCKTGEICSYDPGCSPAKKSCHPDTGGDAIAITYCGCDGKAFTSSQLFPTTPYEKAGECGGDAGPDGSDGGDGGDAADGGDGGDAH